MGGWQVYLHTGQIILKSLKQLESPIIFSHNTDRFKKNHNIFKNASSQCTFINKKKTQPAFTVMTRMLIKYWKEIIKWIPNAFFFFYTKRKQRFLVTQWPLAKWSHWPEKLDASMARSACRALSALFLLKQKQSKAIVYSTSQQLWSQLLLHNDYTSGKKMCWIAIMPLFELKKWISEFIKENRPLVANRGQPFSCSCVFPFRYSSMQP